MNAGATASQVPMVDDGSVPETYTNVQWLVGDGKRLMGRTKCPALGGVGVVVRGITVQKW